MKLFLKVQLLHYCQISVKYHNVQDENSSVPGDGHFISSVKTHKKSRLRNYHCSFHEFIESIKSKNLEEEIHGKI